MMGIGRVTGWLTPFRYEEIAANAMRLMGTAADRSGHLASG
jgi:hypothetical protein